MAVVNEIDRLKLVLRERECPFFSDEELLYYYEQNKRSFQDTARQCLLLKSEETALSVSGLSCADTSKYFRRMSQMYRKSKSCILSGG